MSGEEKRDPARSLVKSCKESEPALMSVIFFISALPEQSEIPLVESGKGEKTVNLLRSMRSD